MSWEKSAIRETSAVRETSTILEALTLNLTSAIRELLVKGDIFGNNFKGREKLYTNILEFLDNAEKLASEDQSLGKDDNILKVKELKPFGWKFL